LDEEYGGCEELEAPKLAPPPLPLLSEFGGPVFFADRFDEGGPSTPPPVLPKNNQLLILTVKNLNT